MKFGNWRGTGSGKTRTTVAIASGLTLVICPKTQFEDQIWQKEWLLQGKNPADLIVLSKEKFKQLFLFDPLSVCNFKFPETIIIDEAHTVAGVLPETRQKNYIKYPKTSQIFNAVVKYIQLAKPDRVHPLTATPSASPMSLYAFGIILGRNFDFFQFREAFYYEATIRGYTRWLPKFRRKPWKNSKPEAIAFIEKQKKDSIELAAKTKESLGYTGTLQDWFDVPEQTFKTHDVGVTAEMESKYKELRLLFPDPLVQAGKRQKLEQGLFEGSFVKENKTEAIAQYMHEFGRVVVFCRYTDQIEMYRKHFEGEYKVLVLNGATKNRKELLEEANASEECLFIAQCQISSGWELPDFPCMVFASLNYSFVDFDQAKGRILRANKLKKNLYVFLIAGKGDELVKQVVDDKKVFSEAEYANVLCKNTKLR